MAEYHEACYLGGSSIDFVATITARLGYLVAPKTLLYVHGGYAYAEAGASIQGQAPRRAFPVQSVADGLDGSVYGFGAEYAFSDKGRIRMEYSNYDFGTISTGKYHGFDNTADFDSSNVQVALVWKF